ncbi:MAG: hypothetical protein KC414_14260, partial [Romboutsia sp.]|nr:hypothetical protein [Romboutsia sp.]
KIYVPTSYDFMIMEITNYTILQRSIATTILFILYIYADINNLEMSTLSKIAIEGMKLYVGYTDITIPSGTFSIFNNITVKDTDKERIKLITWDIDENRKEIKLDFDYDRFFALTKSYSNTVHIY